MTDAFEMKKDTICEVIKNFSLSFGSGSSGDDLKSLLSKTLVPLEILDDVMVYALGFIKAETDRLLEQRKPAYVRVEQFRSKVISFIRKHDRRTILDSFAKAPSEVEIKTDLDVRTYIRQMELIECDDDEKIEAVTDFLRAAVDRTQWSLKGWVDDMSFDYLEEDLIKTWKNLKRRANLELSDRDSIERGKYLYSLCSEHRTKLEGLEVPYYFTTGSFHAVSDRQLIGWHPEYKHKIAEAAKGTK